MIVVDGLDRNVTLPSPPFGKVREIGWSVAEINIVGGIMRCCFGGGTGRVREINNRWSANRGTTSLSLSLFLKPLARLRILCLQSWEEMIWPDPPLPSLTPKPIPWIVNEAAVELGRAQTSLSFLYVEEEMSSCYPRARNEGLGV